MDVINPVLTHIFTNEVRVFLLVGLLLIAMAELGHRLGLRLHHSKDEPRTKQVELIQGSVLGLMSLLLGFTFAMAVQRFEQRRNYVVQEANAIGTAFVRASFLPAAVRLESENLYRRYAALRLELISVGTTPAGLTAHEAEAGKIQQRLWELLTPVLRENPNTVLNSYAQALTEMMDFDAIRLASLRNHVPGAVWLLLLVLSATGCWFTGYRAGATGRRSKLSQIALPVLITVVITLVSDLDRPQHGLIGLDERSLQDVQRNMGSAPPGP